MTINPFRIFFAVLTICVVFTIGHAVLKTNRHVESTTEWEQVCNAVYVYYDETCTNLEPPTVVESSIIGLADWPPGVITYGLYFEGEPWIFVRPGLTSSERSIVIMHEMFHYIDHELDDLVPDQCEEERMARVLSGDDPWDELTKELYGCN